MSNATTRPEFRLRTTRNITNGSASIATDSVDYPGLLADVLDGLLSMTEENWAERCEELAELLRPAVG